MSEDNGIPGSVGDMLRPLQDLISKISELTQSAAAAGARATPDFVAEPLAEFTEGVVNLSDKVVGPLRHLLEEQRQLADQMAMWAEKHRELSAQIAGWAEEHRRLTERMQTIVAPVLEQADGLSHATRNFVEELRHR